METHLNCQNCERLERKLQSALAAIEKQNFHIIALLDTLESDDGDDAEGVQILVDKVREILRDYDDLSALREHDAEILRLADATAKALRVQLSSDIAEAVRILRSVDPSVLHKHDAKLTEKVRKPLVDLLRKAKPLIRAESLDKIEQAKEVMREVNDALEKVKH
jgi:hypothetical protein